MADKNLVELGVAAMLRKAPVNYSVEDCNGAFREEFKKLAGNYDLYRRNKIEVFELLQEIYNEILPIRAREQYGELAELMFIPHGAKATFTKRVGRARAKSYVTKLGLGGVFETFRLDTSEFEVPTFAVGGAAVVDFERFLAGQEDLSEYGDVLMEGIDNAIYDYLMQAINACIGEAKMPAANKYTGSAFSKTDFDALINTVRAYGDPVIVATPEFADTIPANYATGNGTTRVSATDVEDIRSGAYLRMYKGCPIVVLKQSFKDETNAQKVINPQFCYIIPGAGTRIARVVFEGGVVVDEFKNKDRSMELSMYQKVGFAVLHHNNWAICQNTSL